MAPNRQGDEARDTAPCPARPRSAARMRAAAALLAGSALTACELQEVTVAESEDIVVAEVRMQVGAESNRVTAFLHRTEDGGRSSSGEVPGALIRLFLLERGLEIRLLQADLDECVVVPPESNDPVAGSCYVADPLEELLLAEGDTVRLQIDLPDGSQLFGATRVPGGFQILSPGAQTCRLDAAQTVEIAWSGSKGTWAYVAETFITGLRDVLPPDVEVDDPLNLIGLSVSAADTAIVFPSEFGIFDRFDLDRDLALILQEGLPPGITSAVIVGAADRNWVNWARGGTFNPSGQVRIPSIQGDGIGVFGSVVRRNVRILTEEDDALPPCGP